MSENFSLMLKLLPWALLETAYMVFASGFFALLFGLPIGIFLMLTEKRGLKSSKWLYQTLSVAVNIGRSVPFAILIVAIIPFTRLLMGTSLGSTAAIVPLSIAAIPFFARVVEGALKEVPVEIVETTVAMGVPTAGIVLKVLLPEALPGLIRGMTLTLVNLIGYSAMAGLVGGGGLGKIAIQYGYMRFNGFLMVVTVVVLVVFVACIEWGGEWCAGRVLKRRGY